MLGTVGNYELRALVGGDNFAEIYVGTLQT